MKYQDFPSKIFCLTVPKKIVGEHLSVSLISGTRFFVDFFFRLAVPKHFLEEPLYAVFQKILGREKDYG